MIVKHLTKIGKTLPNSGLTPNFNRLELALALARSLRFIAQSAIILKFAFYSHSILGLKDADNLLAHAYDWDAPNKVRMHRKVTKETSLVHIQSIDKDLSLC